MQPALFPTPRIPYVIVAPPYARTSAGVKALHLLCHALNCVGERAYLVFMPPSAASPEASVHPLLNTPILTAAISRRYAQEGITPIVLYAETIRGNPLNAPIVARYILNYPGLLGGDKTFPPNEILLAYSGALAQSAGIGPERVLFIPTSDTSLFHPPAQGTPRSGSCFYAGKYVEFHRGELYPITQGSIEITRNRPDSQTPEQLAALFQHSEYFYTYENTALATEATLCGCPAIFIPNPHLPAILALDELGRDGYGFGTDPATLVQAKAGVGKAFANYEQAIATFWQQLAGIIALTQAKAQAAQPAQATPIRLPAGLAPGPQTLSLLAGYARSHGTGALAKKLGGVIRREGVLALISRSLRDMLRVAR